MENTPMETRRVVKISRKQLAVFLVTVLIVGFLGVILLISSKNKSGYRYDNDLGGIYLETSSVDNSVMPLNVPETPTDEYYPNEYGYYPQYRYDTPTINDTREFMKTSYGAEINTRDVKDTMRNVKNAIDSADGRIDNLNETKEYATVSFVIPKSNFYDFRDEIESITHKKLYTENTSSENLLGQKQSIEERAAATSSSLLSLQNELKDLSAKHTQTVSNLQKEITKVQNQLSLVRTTILETTDPNQLTTLRNQEYALVQQELSLKRSLNSENEVYAEDSQIIKNEIANAEAQLKNIEKQDTALIDNVETVNGYISISWISVWAMAIMFSPVHPIIILIILVLIALFYLWRKNYLPVFEFV